MRVADLVAVCEAHFGHTVQKITAPGGRGRASARVHFDRFSVIATRRPDTDERQREVDFLRRMDGAGAAVPRFLGISGDIVFQEDLGKLRLSRVLARDRSAATGAARQALVSLWALKRAVRDVGLLAELPVIASHKDWALDYIASPVRLSRALRLAPPPLEHGPLLATLLPAPAEFVKWDARPGNAMVLDDGTVGWFDWEHYGRRGGFEDIPFLFGDEFWTLDAAASLSLYEQTAPKGAQDVIPVLIRMTALQVAQRLKLIARRQKESGWVDARTALGQDKMGAAPDLVAHLARQGADWARRDPLVAPMAAWFADVGDAILSAPPPEE